MQGFLCCVLVYLGQARAFGAPLCPLWTLVPMLLTRALELGLLVRGQPSLAFAVSRTASHLVLTVCSCT